MEENSNVKETPKSRYINIAVNIFKSLGKFWSDLDEEIKEKVLTAATGMFDGVLRSIFKENKKEQENKKEEIHDEK